MQTTTIQLKIKEISSKYICLQQSGECLGKLQRFNEKDLRHKPLEFEAIDQRELILAMVQTIYLLYIAQCAGISLRISKKAFVRHIQRGMHLVYVLYIIEEHYHVLRHQHQLYVEKNFDIYEYSDQNSILKQQFLRIIESFNAQIYTYSQKYPEYLGKVYKQPFQEFNFFLHQFIKPNIKLFNDSQALMEFLEKTQLFRDNSLLLNIKMSLLYDKLRPFIQQGIIFEKFYHMQINFKKQFIQTSIKLSRIKLIALFLESILKLLINNKVISIVVSLQGQKGKKNEMQKLQPIQADGSQDIFNTKEDKIPDKWEFLTKNETLLLNPHNFMNFVTATDRQAFQRSNKTELKDKTNHFLLEIDHEREIINLKIICPMVISMENIDSLLYQIQIVGEQWFYPSFQLINTESSAPNLPQNHKKLALSVAFRICPGKSTISRLLTLIDILLVSQKALLAELNKPPYRRNSPYRYNSSTEVMARMSLILLKNIERVYEAQLTPQSDEK